MPSLRCQSIGADAGGIVFEDRPLYQLDLGCEMGGPNPLDGDGSTLLSGWLSFGVVAGLAAIVLKTVPTTSLRLALPSPLLSRSMSAGFRCVRLLGRRYIEESELELFLRAFNLSDSGFIALAMGSNSSRSGLGAPRG